MSILILEQKYVFEQITRQAANVVIRIYGWILDPMNNFYDLIFVFSPINLGLIVIKHWSETGSWYQLISVRKSKVIKLDFC